MVYQFLFFILLLIIIFLISKNAINHIYLLIQKIFRKKKTAVWVLAFVFLPGTVIHEVSHLILALILRVPTGPLSIFPTFDEKEDKANLSAALKARMGHITVAKTDPFRLTIIGVAPMIIGLMIIYFLGNILPPPSRSPFGHLEGVLAIYFLFITSTTMFSSKQDLKSLLVSLPITILIMTALYLTGIKIIVGGNILEKIRILLTDLNRNLILTAVIDYIAFFVLAGLGSLSRRRLTTVR